MTKITDDQAQKMTAEYKELMGKAIQQLDEHKVWLKQKISEHVDVSLPLGQVLVHQVDGITLETVRAEPNVVQLVKENEAMVEKPTLSIIYDYPDELFAYLQHPDTPQELRDSLASANTTKLEEQAFKVERLPDTPGAKSPS